MLQIFSRLEGFLERHSLIISYWACLLVVFYCMLALCNVDLDLWGLLTMGALIDRNPSFFPMTDLASYTALGRPWIYHEWGCGVIFYQVVKHFGAVGLFGFTWALSALLFAIVWQCARFSISRLQPEEHRRMWNLFLFSVAGFMAMGYLFFSVTRCQQFSFLGYALTLWLLQRMHLKGAWKALWLLPVILMLWANLHAGFILGLVAMGLFCLSYAWERQWQAASRLAIILALCLLATGINPYGFAFWEKLIPSWFMNRGFIWEWQNVFLAKPAFGLIYTGFLLIWLWVAAWRWWQDRSRFPLTLSLILATGLEGWLHIKLAPYFLITVLCLGLNEAIPPMLYQGGRPGFLRFNYLLARFGPPLVAVYFGFLALNYTMTHAQPFSFAVKGAEPSKYLIHYPLGLTRLMQEHRIKGNIWLPFDWGEWMTWLFHPQIRVSMDGRYETVYPEAVAQDNFAFYMPPYRTELLRKYPATDWVIVPTSVPALINIMQRQSNWKLCYKDEVAVLFSKPGRCPAKGKRFSNQTQRLDAFIGDLNRFRLVERIEFRR